jgi:glucosamine-6-phosphate deaminase
MNIHIAKNTSALGKMAGATAAQEIRHAIQVNGQANIILATGLSQFETLHQLIAEEIDWSKVVMFHLDEYIGLTLSHPASFRKYLKERFLSKVPSLKKVVLINGEGDALLECDRLEAEIVNYPIDVALVGIGENGHLAFNDPPADFDTTKPYIVVELDDACRKQQLDEGWFASMDEVPRQAISMSIKQILLSKHIICSVPDERKAVAVQRCFSGSVSNLYPASILMEHTHCDCYLDEFSSALLNGNKQHA